MTSLNTQLWELIKSHKLPEDATGRPFIEQLMDENRISRDTANVAIEEYQKFMYLCATRSARNVPSQAVDLVWHLHMQHSRDYWDVFCKKLGKPIHHSPGGEGRAHLDDYKATVKAYMGLFGTPPKGIWKRNKKLDVILGLIFMMVFIVVGIKIISAGEARWFGVLWLSGAIYCTYSLLSGLTTKGELTFIFANHDPFSDDDAGQCGGDAGGCGD